MKMLFIHQNFPGQYRELVPFLRRTGGHEIVGLGEAENIKKLGCLRECVTLGYPTPPQPGETTHPYLRGMEAAVLRGQAVAGALRKLKSGGFAPDVISLHPGWGDGLFVRTVFPDTPLVMLGEWYYRAGEADQGFDPEFPDKSDWPFITSLNNAAQATSMLSADVLLCPTQWQASRFPPGLRHIMRVIHDGINVVYMTPDPTEQLVLQRLPTPGHSRALSPGRENAGQDGGGEACGETLRLSRTDKIVTYMARNLEPCRGVHVFLRSLPELQRRHPDTHILIVGSDGTSYSRALPDGRTYKAKYLEELSGQIDLSRVHFLGRIDYVALRAVFRVSSAHVYLTYPFVLSWSCLEAMACEALLVASATPPVTEVIEHGHNGLLVDFFDREALVGTLDEILRGHTLFDQLRVNAGQFVRRHYHLKDCLGRQMALLEEAGSR